MAHLGTRLDVMESNLAELSPDGKGDATAVQGPRIYVDVNAVVATNRQVRGRSPLGCYCRVLSESRDCDRAVIRQVQNLEEHRGLRTHTG